MSCWKTDLDRHLQRLQQPGSAVAEHQPDRPVGRRWWSPGRSATQIETRQLRPHVRRLTSRPAARRRCAVRVAGRDADQPTAGTGNPEVNIGGERRLGPLSPAAPTAWPASTPSRSFHLDSDSSVQFGGLAVDDVTVTACRALVADLSITKTDGVTTATPGGSVTYTITASNAGPEQRHGRDGRRHLPGVAHLHLDLRRARAAAPARRPARATSTTRVNLPSGGSVTYTASCTISAAATGTLSNTATVTAPAGVTDPTPGNNSRDRHRHAGGAAPISRSPRPTA